MRALVVAIVVALTWTGLTAASGQGAVAAPASTRVFTDSRTEVPSGVGLYRVRVTNRAQLVITTKHRDLRRHAYGNGFTIFVDTRTSHPGPEYAIVGGLHDGSDWVTARATRRWKVVRGDAFGEIWSCNSDLKIDYKTDKLRVVLGRDCLGGYQGRVRVSVRVGDQDFADYGPAKETFYPWIPRG
jgi:hypothetical protein